MEDAHKAMKKFSQIFLAERQGGNRMIKGLIRVKTSWEVKVGLGNYCGLVGNLDYLEKGSKAGNGGIRVGRGGTTLVK